jgi:hypothetical protein
VRYVRARSGQAVAVRHGQSKLGTAVEARAVRFALVPRGSVSYGGRVSVRFGSVGQACWVSVRRSG